MPRPHPPHPARAVLVMRRITIERAAAETGYTAPWVSRVLNRREPASPAFRRRLAAFLRMPQSALFHDDEAQDGVA